MLKQLNFWMQFSPQLGHFMNWCKDLLDLDFAPQDGRFGDFSPPS
jgi:hypothetical protein